MVQACGLYRGLAVVAGAEGMRSDILRTGRLLAPPLLRH